MKRYYIGVDWGDRLHQVWVCDQEGKKVREIKVVESVEGMAEIEAYWRAGLDLGLAEVAFDRRVLEDVAGVLELGRYAIAMSDRAAARSVEHGSYLVLHTQTDDGSWRRAVEVFNPDGPASARRSPGKEER